MITGFKQELMDLTTEVTCDCCGRTRWEPDYVKQLYGRRWFRRKGYWLSIRRIWKVCLVCLPGAFEKEVQPRLLSFDKWIMPVIRHMPALDPLDRFPAVQPMNLPPARIFYPDQVHREQPAPPRGHNRHLFDPDPVDFTEAEEPTVPLDIIHTIEPGPNRNERVYLLKNRSWGVRTESNLFNGPPCVTA